MKSILSWFHNLFTYNDHPLRPPPAFASAMAKEMVAQVKATELKDTCAKEIMSRRILEIEHEKEWLRKTSRAEVHRAVSDGLRYAVDQYSRHGRNTDIYPSSLDLAPSCFPFFVEEFTKQLDALGVLVQNWDDHITVDGETLAVLMAKLKLDLSDKLAMVKA